ncbi:hypothetical protein Ancab_032620 [Ancistrocladus abbreviatus]
MWDIKLLVVGLLVVLISHWVYTWRNPKSSGKLPPGSMGLPFIGETIQYFTPNSVFGVPPFVTRRVARYGPLFRTSIVGQKVVVCADPEISHFIFQQEGKIFQCFYTASSVKILGRKNIMQSQGIHHKYMRKLSLRILSPENLKENVLHEIDAITQKYLESWTHHASVDVKEATADMVFDYFAKMMMGYEESMRTWKLRDCYNAFLKGFVSFPLNIPGTAFHACMEGRRNAVKVIQHIFNERKQQSKAQHHDFVDFLLEEVKREDSSLDEEGAVDLVFVLLFASHETVSSAITLAINFLAHNPSVLHQLTKEQTEVAKRLEMRKSKMTWEDYRSMSFTHMVINETIRLGNIVPRILRKVIKDVEIKGYTIPTGWYMMLCPPSVHLDPVKYEDPLSFNPWRWQGKELHMGTKSFIAFGGGARLCAGADFAKLQMALCLHHLLTKYKWRKIKGGNILRAPGLFFPNGLHIQLVPKESGLCKEVLMDATFQGRKLQNI